MSNNRKAPGGNGQTATPLSMDQTVSELRASMGWQPTKSNPTAPKASAAAPAMPSYPLSDPGPAPESRETIPENIMDLLVEKYTRFAQLMARGKLQPMDIKSVRAICNQVDASAAELEREAQKRRWIAKHIRKSIDLVAPPRPARTAPPKDEQ